MNFTKKEKVVLVVIVFFAILNFFVWQEVFDFLNERLEVVFFDVGQGDSILTDNSCDHQDNDHYY